MTADLDQANRRVRLAARALGRAGLAHAYGHCSLRLDKNTFLVCAPRPMGQIANQEAGSIVPVNGPLPEGVLGEVRIHQQIYTRHPDIRGICRSMPPQCMILSTMGRTPAARHGPGTYFSPGAPLWDNPQLIRSEQQAKDLVAQMGDAPAIFMRGNGVVTAAASIEDAVVLTWYIEDAARVELGVIASGAEGICIPHEEAQQRAIRGGRIFERMWDYLTYGDPELK